MSAAAVLLVLAACTTRGPVKAYEGPARPPEELALVAVEDPTMRIAAIDGRPLPRREPVTEAWIEPGERRLTIEAIAGPAPEALTLRAVTGESYAVRLHEAGDTPVYWVEGRTGDVVAGRAAGPSAYDGLDEAALLARFHEASANPALRGDLLEHTTNEAFAIQAFRIEPDATRRVTAIQRIGDQDFLAAIALVYDEDPMVRREAIAKLDRVDTLSELAVKSPDDGSRFAAKERLRYLSEHGATEELRKAAHQAARRLIREKRW